MIHDPQISLLLLQSSCFSITLVLAVLLLLSRTLLQRTIGTSYDTSRWMLFSALMLFALHYLLQMIFGFRAQGDDVGALINIMFYMPAAFLIECAMLHISTSKRCLYRFVAVGLCCNVTAAVLFGVGWATYGCLHMPWTLPVMGVVFVTQILYFIISPGKELRRMENLIESETAVDITDFRLHMRSGTALLCAMGLIGALSIYYTQVLLVIGVLFLLALTFYVMCFIALGFNISAVSSVVEDAKVHVDVPPTDDAPTQLTPEQKAQIAAGIAQWREEHGYTVQNLNSTTMAQRLGVSKRQLTQYLHEVEGETFRVWLSNIRIEEAKRLLLDTHAYSVESIAEACGFTSRTWMQEKFKASTGMTPLEWRAARK